MIYIKAISTWCKSWSHLLKWDVLFELLQEQSSMLQAFHSLPAIVPQFFGTLVQCEHQQHTIHCSPSEVVDPRRFQMCYIVNQHLVWFSGTSFHISVIAFQRALALNPKKVSFFSDTSGPESIVTDEALSVKYKLSCGEIGCCGGTGGPRSK